LTADSDPSSQNEPTTEAKEAEQKSIQTENDGETQLPITAASTTPAEAETASETATVANEEPSETAVIDRKNSESDTNRNSNETKETDEPVITTRPAAPVKSEASGPLQGEDVDSTDSHADSPKENSVSTSATATDKETSATGTRSNSPPSSESVSGGTIASGGKGPSPHGVPEGQVISAERRKPLGSIPQPKYPQRDRVMNKEGQVILIGHVRLDGLIDKVWVESSTGSPEMVKSSVEAFTKWRFEPGTEAYVRKGIQFSLKGNVETGYARLGESEEK
jgi:TonB family protein